MSMDDVQDRQLELISITRDSIESLIDRPDLCEVDTTLRRLLGYFSGRSQTISLLVSDGNLLDAEIILRSLNECFAKICLICYQPEDQKDDLVDEFWNALGKINNHRKRHRAQKAQDLAKYLGNRQDERVFRALSTDTLYSFSDLNRKERKRLEQKWSYSEIIKFLDSGVVQGAPENAFAGLTHMYGMQSHIAHCDDVALDLILDDMTREPDVRREKTKAHTCRIWSDQLSLWVFIYSALSHHFNEKVEYSSGIWPLWAAHTSEMARLSNEFWATQSEFYEKYT